MLFTVHIALLINQMTLFRIVYKEIAPKILKTKEFYNLLLATRILS
jgi:hypothetical protein